MLSDFYYSPQNHILPAINNTHANFSVLITIFNCFMYFLHLKFLRSKKLSPYLKHNHFNCNTDLNPSTCNHIYYSETKVICNLQGLAKTNVQVIIFK